MGKWILLLAIAVQSGAFLARAEAQQCMEEVDVEVYWGSLSCHDGTAWQSNYVQSSDATTDRGRELCTGFFGRRRCCWAELPYTRWGTEMRSIANCKLGGMDLRQSCRIQTGDNTADVTLRSGPGYAAYQWACVTGGRESGIDMQRACRDAYPDRNAWAKATDLNNPYSWGCYTGQ